MRGERYITKSEEYALISKRGSSWTNELMVLKALPNGLALARYGFSVSRQVGKSVTRNRVKRLFREILRRAPLQPGWDIVFIARPRVAGVNYADLDKAVNSLLSQAGLLRPQESLTGERVSAN